MQGSLPAVRSHQFQSFAIQFSQFCCGDVGLLEGAPSGKNRIVPEALDWIFMVGCGVAALRLVRGQEFQEALCLCRLFAGGGDTGAGDVDMNGIATPPRPCSGPCRQHPCRRLAASRGNRCWQEPHRIVHESSGCHC